MEHYVILVCFGFLTAATLATSPKRYRTDYEYIEATDAFYKFHTYQRSYKDAKKKCELEGSQLVHPGSAADLSQVHGMMKRFPDVGSHVWLLDGPPVNNEDSIEETPVIDLSPSQLVTEPKPGWQPSHCEVFSRRGAIESMHCYSFSLLPFVCKVAAKDAYYDTQCRVYSNRYNYSSALGSCYEASPSPEFTWNEAYSECHAVGSHLVVLNSVAESLYVRDLFVASRDNYRFYYGSVTHFSFVGIRANKPTDGSQRVFKTIFNTTLEEAGFAEWSEGEPNNLNDSEYCAALFVNGKFYDVDCTSKYSFICEVEVH